MKTRKPAWEVQEIERTVHRIVFDVKSGWTSRVLLMSDEHWDNKHCDLDLLKRHHNEAVAFNAPILKFGDTLCLMQGKWDKRSDQNEMRDEHRGNNYLDRVADTAGGFYAPYAQNIALLTPGNHESSIVVKHQTDMIDRVIEKIQIKSGHRINKGGFSGFVILAGRDTDGRIHDAITLYYHHGYGGGGEVTRGMIDNNRTRGQFFADVYYSGHIHRRNMDENEIITCTIRGEIEKRRQWFLRGSTYKDEWDRGAGGYHVSNGRAGRPKGGWWLNLGWRSHKFTYEPVPAN